MSGENGLICGGWPICSATSRLCMPSFIFSVCSWLIAIPCRLVPYLLSLVVDTAEQPLSSSRMHNRMFGLIFLSILNCCEHTIIWWIEQVCYGASHWCCQVFVSGLRVYWILSCPLALRCRRSRLRIWHSRMAKFLKVLSVWMIACLLFHWFSVKPMDRSATGVDGATSAL